MVGDRYYHDLDQPIEDVQDLAVLSLVIARTAGVNDLPLSVFNARGVTVCSDTCSGLGSGDITLSGG